MSAVVVQDVYKKFGKPSDPFWKRVLRLNGKESASNGHNGNGNGHSNNGHSSNGKETLQETAVLTKNENLNKTAGLNGSSNGKVNGNGKEPEKKMVVAVNHVSFTVEKGEIFGVLGPNGGGKSTLIRLISTLLIPDSGNISVFGLDVEKHPMEVQRMINRVSVEASFFKKPSVV